MSELWCPFAIRLDGPEWKTGYEDADGNRVLLTHAKVGATVHTMEYESTPEWEDAKTLYNALFSARQASWTFSACKFMNGAILFQHYPLDAVCWAQGYQGNLWLVGIEVESKSHGAFSESEYALLVKLLRWLKENMGWREWAGVGNKQTKLTHEVGPWLFEHNAVPMAPSTDCAVFTHGQLDPERLLRDLREEPMGSGLSQVSENWILAQIRSLAGHPPMKVRIDGTGHVYAVTADALVHIGGPDQPIDLWNKYGFSDGEVKVIQPDDPILAMRTVYPFGVPEKMRT